jgi:hypothetical protein
MADPVFTHLPVIAGPFWTAIVNKCRVPFCHCPVSIYHPFPANGAQTGLSPIWYSLAVYLICVYVHLTRSLDVVDRVVLRSLGWFLQPRPRSTSSRRQTSSHSGCGIAPPSTCELSVCLDTVRVDLAHSRTVHSRECGVMHARPGALCAAPACLSTVRSRSDRPWYIYPSLRVRTTVEHAVSHMTNTFRYKNVFVTSSVSHFHHDIYNVDPMAWPLAQVLDLVASSLVTKTASPRAPAPLRTRACPSSALGGSPAGHPSSRCSSRSVVAPHP